MKKRICAFALAFVMVLSLVLGCLPGVAFASAVHRADPVTIKFHYTREDGNYEGWQLNVWSDYSNVCTSSDVFEDNGEDSVVTVTATAHPKTIAFIIWNADLREDDPSQTRWIEKVYPDLYKVASGTLHVYCTSGTADFTVVEGDDIVKEDPASVTVKVHYNRPDGDYEGWIAYAWDVYRSGYYEFVEENGEMVATMIGRPNSGFSVSIDKRDAEGNTLETEGNFSIDYDGIYGGTIHVYIDSANPDEVVFDYDDAIYSYYVAGTSDLCGSEWACGDKANKMTYTEAGLFEIFYENVPAGEHQFKVTDGTWDKSWGDNGSNYVFTTTEVQNVLIVFNAGTEEITVSTSDIGDPYYVAGTGGLCGSEWACNDASNKMGLHADGLYKKTYKNVPAGEHQFKVTDGTWDNCWGDNGSNYTFTTIRSYDVTITFNPETKEIKVYLQDPAPEEPEEVAATYYVAGYAALCGNEWACDDANNKMTLDSDGLYKKTYEKVPAGTYEFKVTDGTWDNCWGDNGNNYTFTIAEEKDVTITFNADTKEIGVILSDVGVPYYVAGYGSLCGSEWNPGDPANKMDLNEDGLYEKTYYSVPAGSYEFKVTDGTWNNSWGDNSNNYSFTTATECNVTIIFNAETCEITVTTVEVLPFYVAGSDSLCGVGWDPGYAANKMTLGADGLYTKTFKSVPAGTHECKITDGSWDNNWGVGGANGANYTFSTEEVCDVTIIFNSETFEISHELSEATAPEVPVEPVEYPITVKVHYYRPDGNYGDWEVHMWNGSGVSTVSATREFELEEVTYEGTTYGATATYYTNSNETWVGFIVKKPDWTKDPDGDRKIDISDVLSGTVHVYAKTGSALDDFDIVKDDCVKGAKIIGAKWDSLTGILTVKTSMPVEGDLMEAFMLEGPDGEIEITSVTKVDGANEYVLGYPEGAISNDKAYKVYFNGASCDVTIPNTYSTETFEAAYTYTGNDLGANWSEESTTFRVWAPTAAEVYVNLYTSGNAGADDLIESVEMTQDVNGTWIATVDGDQNGVYYTYSVNIQGKVVEACDPYARTTGVNGNRAMVIDLDSTDPEGWENDDYVTVDNYTDAVIWELHVRDFSIDENSGMENKGKYLAFTELGTVVPGTEISTGVDYMVDLGVNYVHLLPVYDINSVDETTGGYNWGYDPKNYNVPEGSYSTDPYNGEVRVTEFKQMVQSLHNNGIGVIMDVVYNHVADAGTFCFNQIVPGYFSRVHDDGSYQGNSGCGNDTASERAMVRKYIVDSVLYWAEEYHIDGFRWDLVGLIDYETINEVMAAVHEVNPDIIFYGEGWEMCSWTTKDEGDYESDPYSKKMTIQPNDHMVNTEAGIFAFFNDTIRNLIHGGVFTATDKGFVSGNLNNGSVKTLIDSYMGNSNWGSNNGSVDTPLQTINYASCHDNYTLFDNLTIDVMDATGCTAAEAAAKAAEMNRLAATYYITAQGVPFIHAGEEMLRSKPDSEGEHGFNHNSYASGDVINSFKWGDLANELNADTYEYYKGLIAFRKAHPAMRMTSEEEVLAAMSALETDNINVVAILNEGGNGEDAQILSIFNADSTAHIVTLPEGKWNVYVDQANAGTEILATVEGRVEIEATSAMILVKASEAVSFTYASLSLTGNIGVNFYAEIPDEVANAENAYMLFTVNGTEQIVPVAGARQEDGSYKFTCTVAAKQMADTITGQIFVGETPVSEAKTYSVQAYCRTALEYYADDGTQAAMVALAKAMLNYGAASQIKFNYKTDNLANAILSEEDQVLPESVDVSDYAHVITGSEDGIIASDMSLVLESETSINIYFLLTGDKAIDDYTFLFNGTELKATEALDGSYFVKIPNIVAKNLDKAYTVQVGGLSVTCSGLSYVKLAQENEDISETLLNVAKAIYVYNQAANAYFGA